MRRQPYDAGRTDLERALRALAAEDRQVRVPPEVHATVMRGWDATTSVRPKRVPHHSWWIALAGAAAAGVLAATVFVSRDRPNPLPTGAAPFVETVPSSAGPDEKPREPETRVAKRPPRTRRRPSEAPAVRTTRTDDGIVLVADPVLDASALSVVRIRMPRSALPHLGIPIANPDATGSVDLEVLVGEDGIARTIRRALPVTESDPLE